MKNQRKDGQKEHADSLLEDAIRRSDLQSVESLGLGTEEILHILGLGDETRDGDAEGLADRKFARLAAPAAALLNSVIDLKLDSETHFYATYYLVQLVRFLGQTYTDEAYQELTKLLNRLLTQNLNLKHLLLTDTVCSLAEVSAALDREDSVSILKSAVPQLQNPGDNLSRLAECFDRLNAPDGIKEILIHRATGKMPDEENRCLALLQKHDPDFVEKWRAQKAKANTENKDSP